MAQMPKTPSTQKRVPPDSFNQYNRAQYQRVMQLTAQAITKLESERHPVTLTAVVEITRDLDGEGRGISARTILRNSEASELFRLHSPAYQVRRQKVKKAKRKRTKVKANARTIYRGLHSSDLIQMVEDLKQQNVELKARQEKLQAERDAAYRMRDEALQHNTRQLVALTTKTRSPDKKR